MGTLAVALPPRPLVFAGVVIAKTTMTGVVDHFGAAPRFETGDAGDAEDKVCYRIGSGRHMRFVYFIIGELGGGTAITGVRVTPNARSGAYCVVPQNGESELKAAVNEFADESGTRRRLSMIGFARDPSNQWTRCRTVKIDNETFDNCAFVRVRYEGGVLTQLDLSVAITN